jgi:hypothetical protein
MSVSSEVKLAHILEEMCRRGHSATYLSKLFVVSECAVSSRAKEAVSPHPQPPVPNKVDLNLHASCYLIASPHHRITASLCSLDSSLSDVCPPNLSHRIPKRNLVLPSLFLSVQRTLASRQLYDHQTKTEPVSDHSNLLPKPRALY